MPQITQISSFSSATFNSLISSDELLRIENNKVSILSARSTFCKIFYFLPRVPTKFAINPLSPDRFALIYPPNENNPASLVILETRTGNVLKAFNTKIASTHTFDSVSMGTHVYFTMSAQPNTVFFSQVSTGSVSSFENSSKVADVIANYDLPQFLVINQDNSYSIVETQGPHILKENIPFSKYTFMQYNGGIINVGLKDRVIQIMDLDNETVRNVEVPHKAEPLGYSNGIALTDDGIIFSTEDGSVLAYCFQASAMFAWDSTLAIVCKDETKIFEVLKIPIASVLPFQPPEPFVSSEYVTAPSTFFASTSAIYVFSLSLNESSKFADLQGYPKIKQICAANAMVSAVYRSGDGKKVMTYVTGAKQRDEKGIDACTDSNGLTWILQQDGIYSFSINQLSIQQRTHIGLPDDHQFTRIFPIRNTVAIYSSKTGISGYVIPGMTKIVPFHLPSNIGTIKIFRWPALVTRDRVYICTNDDSSIEDINPSVDYVSINGHFSSCCWLAWTLFAVQGRSVYAIGRSGRSRMIQLLPNAMCAISAALPSGLVFVTTLPDYRVIVLRQPVLFECLCDADENTAAIRYIISHMPSLSLDARMVTNIHPVLAMSVFDKQPPQSVNKRVVEIYCRFGRYAELRNVVSRCHGDKSLKRQIAEHAKRSGQFETARQLYEELGDEEALFSLFIICRNAHNLQVLASKSSLAPAVEFFGCQPIEDEYEILPSLQLPRLRPLIQPDDFLLFTGIEDDKTPLDPVAFDEVTDFGIREYPISSEDNVAAAAADNEQPVVEDQTEKVYSEKPVQQEEENTKDKDLTLDKVFFDEEEDTKDQLKLKPKLNLKAVVPGQKKITTNINFSLAAPTGAPKGRRRTNTCRPNKATGLGFLSELDVDTPKQETPSSTPQIPDIGTDDTEEQQQPRQDDNYVSTLFMDI